MNKTSKKVDKAYEFARKAYLGKTDVSGRSLFEKQEAIFSQCRSENEKIVALLAEVLQVDATKERDLYMEFGITVRDAVLALTPLPGESKESIFARAKTNPISRAVKIAELKLWLGDQQIDDSEYQRSLDKLFS